jgi:pimeloyl-ACP methyl ester carboxylesterase
MADRNHIDDLRGATRLAVEATKGVAELVEAVHQKAAGPFAIFSKPAYASVRGVASLVGAALDRALGPLAALAGESASGQHTEPLRAALNGVLGDYLEATGNPLAIALAIRRECRALPLERDALARALPHATGRLLVFLHGSSMCDLAWRKQPDYAAALERRGHCAVFVHYNSGLHIPTNGRAVSALLEQAAEAWPLPLEEIALVGHSMGGLVARSACHAASLAGHRWLGRLRNLVCLGSPHHGASLERFGNLFGAALGISGYSAPFQRLARLRSAGVTDLRFGNVREEDVGEGDRFAVGGDPRLPLPLPAGVRCFAVAGTLSGAIGGSLGDGLVSLESALGRHPDPARALAFPPEHCLIAPQTAHLDLLCNAEVCAALERWLS